MTTALRPAAGPPRHYRFPQFERRRLSNGITLVVAPVRKLPVVTVMMIAEAGAVTEPRGQEGVAYLAAKALLEGTAGDSGVRITERMERLGATIEVEGDWDASIASMTVLKARLQEAFEQFALVIGAPDFPDREVERLKNERLAELLQTRTEPRTLATDMFSRFVYAPESRYALPESGSEASIASLDREAVIAFYRARFRAGGLTLVFAGDISADEAAQLVDASFGSWPDAHPVAVTPVIAVARSGPAVHLVEKDDAPQSEVRVGHIGLARAHPDYYDVLVMNAVLGGLFSSRINLNLREAHGYTYGASSAFDFRRHEGPFVISTAVRSDVTEAALREILVEIARMRTEVVSMEELTLATSFLEGVFPIKYETTTAIARGLAALVIYDLPADYFESYRSRIREVTPERVLRAAVAHVHPDELQVVVVGDASAIAEPLRRLRNGPVTVYDAEGRALS